MNWYSSLMLFGCACRDAARIQTQDSMSYLPRTVVLIPYQDSQEEEAKAPEARF